MADYDVIVIGAGPAGSSVARTCAKAGLSVMVYEKMTAPFAVKRCAEGLMNKFEERFEKIPKKCISQDINGAVFIASNNKKFSFELEGYGGYVVDRKVFDVWLNEIAMKEGAKFQMNTNVSDVIKENGFVKGVKIERDGEATNVTSKIVVAADGVESTVARKAGLNTTHLMKNIWCAYQVKMEGIELEDSHKLYMYFGKNIAPKGYLWIFPKGDDSANIGLAIAPGTGLAKKYADDFISSHAEIRKGTVVEENTGAIPSGGFMENMVLNGLAVVGDAAHQVNPIHGGGIIEAYTAGQILGNVIAECDDKNGFSQKALGKYNELWWSGQGKKLKNAEKLRDIALGLSDEDFGSLLGHLDMETIKKIEEGSITAAVNLLIKNPKLAFLATKLVV